MQTTRRKKALAVSLKTKLILGSTVLVLISVTSLSLMFIQQQRIQIRKQLLTRGETVANLVAYNSRYGVQIGDRQILDNIIGGIVDDPDVKYCIITDREGKIITGFKQENADIGKIKALFITRQKENLEYDNGKGEQLFNITFPVILSSTAVSGKSSSVEDDLFESGEQEVASKNDAAAQIEDQRFIGTVQIGITHNNLKKDTASVIEKTLLYGSLIFLAGFLIAVWLGSIISTPIKKVVTVLNDISQGEGDLSQRIHIGYNDETGDLAAGFNAFMDKFQEIKKISVILNELADGGGDLTKRLNISSQDEVGMLAKGFDRFTGKLHEIICQVARNTEKIAQASQSVSEAGSSLARDLGEMAHESGEVAESSRQITSTIERTGGNVANVNELMNTTEMTSSEGFEIVHDTRNGMVQIAGTIKSSSDVVEALNRSTREIGETISAIKEIADQTKLIAINAAIEASRVGEQGKGFSVVAEEIRRLAARVAKAAQDISSRIAVIRKDSDRVVDTMRKGMEEASKGVDLSNRSEEALRNISKSVSDAKMKMNQIAIASHEQSSAIGVIFRNINSISEAAQESSQGVSRTARAMQELNNEVQALRQLVGRFILDNDDTPA